MKSTRWLTVMIVTSSAVLMSQGLWIKAKAELAQWLLQEAWQQTLQDGGVHKPWAWADHWPVARLSVPAMQSELIVLSADSGHALAFAPGHNSRSALPGQPGVVVISGHRDTHFRFLQDLPVATEVIVETAHSRQRYRVVGSRVVNVNETRIDVATQSQQLMLVTCYPFDALRSGGPLRYVVIADKV